MWYAPDEEHPHAASPRFTSSVDDALDLVPVGKWYLAGKGKTREDEPLYGAQILGGEILERDTVIAEGEHDAHQALAICIAAIRARVAQA